MFGRLTLINSRQSPSTTAIAGVFGRTPAKPSCDSEIMQRRVLVKARDCFRQKRRDWPDEKLVQYCSLGKFRDRHRVRNYQAFYRWIGECALGTWHEKAMSCACVDLFGAMRSRRHRSPNERTTDADEIVHNYADCAIDVADKKISGHDSRTAMLLGKSASDASSQRRL
jgi:hypothetical protein